MEIIHAWAEQTPQVQELRLFGSYAKGTAHSGSDIDLAVRASPGNWTALAAKWEEHLSQALGLKVNIRTLANDVVRAYCDECCIILKQ
jgi:predicted nucleotidyltransferase